MKLLVSFCNQYGDSTHSNLVRIDTETKDVFEVPISVPNMGIHGLATDGTMLVAVFRSDNPGVVLLDAKTWEEIGAFHLKELADPHGVAVLNSQFIITSTGNDQVISYKFGPDRKTVEYLGNRWSPDGSEGTIDTHHINSISAYDGNLFISAFGHKEGELWSTAENGYVYNISQGKIVLDSIYHPHSLSVTQQGIFYCDSSRRRVMREKKVMATQEAGYTRGLAVAERFIAVGSSNGRTKSKSTGTSGKAYTANIADPGILQECCKIQIYENQKGYSFVEEYDFTGKRNEVFDVLIIAD